MIKTIKENEYAEIIEKRSKFIANIFYIECKEEAEVLIKQINKKYFKRGLQARNYKICGKLR